MCLKASLKKHLLSSFWIMWESLWVQIQRHDSQHIESKCRWRAGTTFLTVFPEGYLKFETPQRIWRALSLLSMIQVWHIKCKRLLHTQPRDFYTSHQKIELSPGNGVYPYSLDTVWLKNWFYDWILKYRTQWRERSRRESNMSTDILD